VAKDDAMQEPRAQRTLVKSPPELWAEVSDVEALARHLGEFGEIRITRLDPETTVAWEGDRACGTVALEPSGWGTKVTITAKLAEEAAPQAPDPVAEAEPEPPAPEPEPEAAAPEPEPPAAEPEPPEAEPEPPAAEPEPEAAAPDPVAEADAEPAAPEPEAEAEAPKVGFFARMFGRRRRVEAVVETEPVAAEPEPEPLAAEPEPEAEPVAAEPEPEPLAAEPEADAEPVAVEPEPEPLAAEPEAEPEPRPAPLDAERAEAILTGVLDDLGSAHHRPFSRS
jgi:hypothetical protein